MKKIFAMLLVLALGLLPAAMAESWIEDAVDAGRCLSTEISLQGFDGLEDYRLALNTQETDGAYDRFALIKGDEEILNGFVSTPADEETTYFNVSLFGGKVMAFREGDLAKMVQNIMGMLKDLGVLSSEDIEKAAEMLGGSGSGLSFGDIDLGDVDFTPLMTAISVLEDGITMTEPEEEGFAAEIIVRITPDNVKTILDALLESLSTNPRLGELLEKYADPVGEAEAEILNNLAGDLVIDVLLDEMGTPCYASITLEVDIKDVVCTFVFEIALNTVDADAFALEFKGSCSEGGGAAQTLFEGSVTVEDAAATAALVVGENGAFTLNAVIPAPVETDTLYRVSADADVSCIYEGCKFAYSLNLVSEEENLGGDAARTTVVTIGSADAQKEIMKLTVDQATGEPMDAAPVTGAVYPAEMDSSELTDLGMDLLINGIGLLQKLGVDIPMEALMGMM